MSGVVIAIGHKKEPWHIMLEIQILVWDRHTHVIFFGLV
jgi:hypothetical protein